MQRIYLLFVLLAASIGTYCQEDEQPENSNLLKYTPSLLLDKGQSEIKMFNNLYTQTSFYDASGSKTLLSERSTYFTSINQILIGISSKVNIGYLFFLRSVRIDKPASSPLSVFRFEQSPDSRTAVNFAGPTIRFSPFKNSKRISLQSSFLFPSAIDQEGINNRKPFLDFDKYFWWTQVFYDKILPNYFVLFAEIDLILRLDPKSVFTQSFVYNPVKLFFGKFIGTKWGVYTMAEWGPFWGDKEVLAAYYSQVGLGVKHQILPSLELEASYTLFPAGKNSGAGQTYNLGLRFLK